MDQRLLKKLLDSAQKNKTLLDKRLTQIQETEFSSSVGGGLFDIVINGKFEVVSCFISDRALTDKDTLQDLIITGVNEALSKINKELKEAEKKLIPKMPF